MGTTYEYWHAIEKIVNNHLGYSNYGKILFKYTGVTFYNFGKLIMQIKGVKPGYKVLIEIRKDGEIIDCFWGEFDDLSSTTIKELYRYLRNNIVNHKKIEREVETVVVKIERY